MKRTMIGGIVCTVFAFAGLVLGQTPDAQTPSQESVCDGLSGAAFGLCNAYCEAQDCDVHERPSCERLRRNFLRVTGSSIFPCDARCGDGVVNQEEEECDDGNNESCDGCSPECRREFCGDGVVCASQEEECDDGNTVECDGCSPFCSRDRCGDGIVCPNQGEECEPGDVCPGDDGDERLCNDNCTCCPAFDAIIDTDGTASPTAGGPASQEVRCGDPIISLNATPNVAGLDTLNDALGAFCGFHAWVFGPVGGDDIHLEDPFDDPDGVVSTCPTAIRDAVYNLGADCVVLDLDGSLFDGLGVCCDNACDPLLSFHDLNGNGWYNDGEDIVLDVNGNGIFD